MLSHRCAGWCWCMAHISIKLAPSMMMPSTRRSVGGSKLCPSVWRGRLAALAPLRPLGAGQNCAQRRRPRRRHGIRSGARHRAAARGVRAAHSGSEALWGKGDARAGIACRPTTTRRMGYSWPHHAWHRSARAPNRAVARDRGPPSDERR